MDINLIYFLLVLWILTFYQQVRNNIWECAKDVKLIVHLCGEMILWGVKILLFPVKLIMTKSA